MKYLLKKVKLFQGNNTITEPLDLVISYGKIKIVNHDEIKIEKDYEEIDCLNKILIPSVTDLYANLKSPGQEYQSILNKEITAAIAGGITNISCHPDTDPVLDEPSLIKDLISKANKIFPININPYGAITKNLEGHLITEMIELHDAGATGFSQAEKSIINTNVLIRAFEYAATYGFTLYLRPNDQFLSDSTFANQGSIATRLGIKGLNKNSEIIEVLKYLAIAKTTKTKIHLSKISCGESIEIIERAKNENINVTCDVSINQILFNELDIDHYNTNFHLTPPLRSQADQNTISEGIRKNIVDAICSDHHPVGPDRKMQPFENSEAGASAFETYLSLIFKISKIKNIGIEKLLSKISYQPYKIIYGEDYDLFENQNLDFCLFDTSITWLPVNEQLKSSGKNIPFDWELEGCVTNTFVDGAEIYRRKI